MFREGDIKAERTEDFKSWSDFAPTVENIEAALFRQGEFGHPRPTVYYGLTAQGGAKWEAAARPDWNRFIYGGYSDSEAELISMNRQWVERYFMLIQPGGFDTLFAVPGTEVWDTLEPWQALYWKTLPIGHRVRFTYTSGGEYPSPILDRAKFEAAIRRREESAKMKTWYTRPD